MQTDYLVTNESIPPAAAHVNADLLSLAEMDLLRALQELVEVGLAPAACTYIRQALRTIAAVKRGCANAE